MTTLCVSPWCRADRETGEPHPREADHGLRLCHVCVRWLVDDAHTAATLHADLAEVLAGGSRRGELVRSSRSYGININEDATEARSHIESTLTDMVYLISSERGIFLPHRWAVQRLPEGFIGPPRLLRVVDLAVAAMAAYVQRHATWLAAHPTAGDWSRHLRDIAGYWRTWATAYPTPGDRQDQADRAEARARIAAGMGPVTTVQCCQVLTLLYRRPIPTTRVRKWHSLGHIDAIGTSRNETVFELAEVLTYARSLYGDPLKEAA